MNITEKECKDLLNKAIEARNLSYSPYSKFKVGACAKTLNGKLYTGCNIENSSYTPTICAERVAIFKAVSEGETSFKAIAIACDSVEGVCYPCGVCRQVMKEFFDNDTIIITGNSKTDYKTYTLKDLLPFSFGKENLT